MESNSSTKKMRNQKGSRPSKRFLSYVKDSEHRILRLQYCKLFSGRCQHGNTISHTITEVKYLELSQFSDE